MQQHEHSVRHHQGKREIRAGRRIATLITLIKLVTLTPKQTPRRRTPPPMLDCLWGRDARPPNERQTSVSAAPASEAAGSGSTVRGRARERGEGDGDCIGISSWCEARRASRAEHHRQEEQGGRPTAFCRRLPIHGVSSRVDLSRWSLWMDETGRRRTSE
jgi:hypothetical protein